MPVTRADDKSVFIVCVPNPPLMEEQCEDKKSPVAMLIRVPTADGAEELLQQLNSHKN
jgi:hypothetical protein